MGNKIQHIIDKSGKKCSVSFEGKEKRKSFNEVFGKKKMDIAIDFIGNSENSVALSKILNKK